MNDLMRWNVNLLIDDIKIGEIMLTTSDIYDTVALGKPVQSFSKGLYN